MRFNSFILQNVFTLMIGFTLALTSCSSTHFQPYSDQMISDLNLAKGDVGKLQFYVSRNIVLYNEAGSKSTSIVNGAIVNNGNKKVEKVVIQRGTPGTLVFQPKSDRFGISFDKGDDKKFLMFGPDSKGSQRYTLLAKSWEGDRGLITYGDQTYSTSLANSNAYIMVKLSATNKVNVTQEVAAGRAIK